MNPLYVAGGVSLALNLILGGLYLDKRDDLASAIEACNTDKIFSIAQAEKITRETIQAASAKRLTDLAQIAAREIKARQIADNARDDAQTQLAKVNALIKRIQNEDACLTTPVHPTLLECLRTDANCGETSPGGHNPHGVGAGPGRLTRSTPENDDP